MKRSKDTPETKRLKDSQRKLKENTLLALAKGGWPAHQSECIHLSLLQILEGILSRDGH